LNTISLWLIAVAVGLSILPPSPLFWSLPSRFLPVFPGFSTLISVLLQSLFGGLYFGIILVFYWLFDWVDCWNFKAPTAPLLSRAALAVAAPVQRTSASFPSGPISVSFCGPYCGGFIRSIADFS
jgi:hypothetical protein